MGRIYNSTPPLSRALCPLATCPEELHPPSLSLSLFLEKEIRSCSADNTNLPGLPFCSFWPGTRENGLFSHYAYYVPPAPAPLAPYPLYLGYPARRQAGHHHYAGRRESRYYALSLAAPPLSPFYYGTAVAARARRLSMQKVEFE